MPALVDTTVRLVSQEPLSGRLPTSAILDLAHRAAAGKGSR